MVWYVMLSSLWPMYKRTDGKIYILQCTFCKQSLAYANGIYAFCSPDEAGKANTPLESEDILSSVRKVAILLISENLRQSHREFVILPY